MYGNIIAICLLAMPVVALAAMARAWSPAEDDLWVRVWPTAWFPALWIAFWAPMFMLRANLNYDPNEFVVWIPILSWLAVSLCCRLGRTRKWGLGAVLLITAVTMTLLVLVPEDWANTPRDSDNAAVLSALRSRLRRGGRESSDWKLPAGWIDSPPRDELWKPDRGIDRLGISEQRVHNRVWHTWLTGLYHVTARAAGVWYPGGKPAEAAGLLEWRPR